MSQSSWHEELRVPDTLASQLREFRHRVWTIKLVEAFAAALATVLATYLVVFLLDRLVDTPTYVRAAFAIAAAVACLAIPWVLHHWMWRFRRLDQLARLLSRKMPRIGDQLLGIIELAQNRSEQNRSWALCQAAIEQVSVDAQGRDFRAAVPDSRLRAYSLAAITLSVVSATLLFTVPAAAKNAWARFSSPWRDTPRYTFAALETLPAEIVVPHGEPFTFGAKMAPASLWQPAQATARIKGQPDLVADFADGGYSFEIPPQQIANDLSLRVGDALHHIHVEPKLRPELTAIAANVKLPEYLGLPATQHHDVRGGAISLVKGSEVSFAPVANRTLHAARANGQPCPPAGKSFATPTVHVDDSQVITLDWEDEFGLAGKDAFNMSITAQDDEAPQIACEDLPRGKVVLESEQLVFHVRAHDDFGVQNVGMSWRGIPSEMVEKSAKGESMLAVGGNDKSSLDVQGTFTAKSLGIEPQPIELRVFATDYFPNRKRVHTAPYLLYVLSAEQHAIWITEQLAKWQRQSLEVRDRELQLYEANKRLREMSPAELDRSETRRQIERQAEAEAANGRRLTNLANSGTELLKQAARNPEIGVGHLDKWAEMLQILSDISANRMPSVAGLLKGASKAPMNVAAAKSGKPAPMAGQSRAEASPGSKSSPKPGAKNAVPKIVDMESSQQPKQPLADSAANPNGKPSNPTLRLAGTTLVGQAKPGQKPPSESAPESVDQAVVEQRDLLAEFEKVADELNTVLANLEGSTLVKRLKAASRQQYSIAGRINDHIGDVFGVPLVEKPAQPKPTVQEQSGLTAFGEAVMRQMAKVDEAAKEKAKADMAGQQKEQPIAKAKETLTALAHQEDSSVEKISYIMDDMAAYFERHRMVRFKSVLDDMRKQDVLGGLRQLSDEIPQHHGLSIAQCEFWSDAMDRWAEDLVDPANSGACPGGRSKGSLPPSIVLEVLQILEGEVNLREETRVAEQAKSAVEADMRTEEAKRLSFAQSGFESRVAKVVDRIRQLPDGEADFAKEIALLEQVNKVMHEAAGILDRPETGAPAIAAETEAIELLLKSQRINPKGGGGGGANPGGGGTGTTQDSALALIGAGLNQKEVRQSPAAQQSTGETGSAWPEEFRAGLDKYFSGLESKPE